MAILRKASGGHKTIEYGIGKMATFTPVYGSIQESSQPRFAKQVRDVSACGQFQPVLRALRKARRAVSYTAACLKSQWIATKAIEVGRLGPHNRYYSHKRPAVTAKSAELISVELWLKSFQFLNLLGRFGS